MIVVGAIICVGEGKGEEFLAEYRKLAPKVRSDPGAVTYVLHRDANDPCRFFFYEKYENEEAVNYHASAPHVKEFFRTIGPIMKGQPEIKRYREVD